MKLFGERMLFDKEGGKLNPITLIGVEGSDPKKIGEKLADINERMRTGAGEYRVIGSLYGFNIVVKTESSGKDIFDLSQNKFMIEGVNDGENGVRVKYSYNNGNIASDPKLASLNFLNAMERIPKLIEQEQAKITNLQQDIPVLKSVISGEWKKEDELKALRAEVATLERKITLSLKPVDKSDHSSEQSQDNGQSVAQSANVIPSQAEQVKSRGVKM